MTRRSSMQLDILSYLSNYSPTSVAELGRAIDKLRPSASRSLNLLRAQGLVKDFQLTKKGTVELSKYDFRMVHDVEFHWFDCNTSFDCPCGETEIYMDEETNKVECKCDRIYKFMCRLEVKNDPNLHPDQ